MIKKILIVLIILCLCIGFVSAVEIKDFELMDGFKPQSTNFASNCEGYSISVAKYSDDAKDLVFKNDAANGYTVKIGSISNYTDSNVKNTGCLEVVEFNGEKLLIEIYHDGLNNQDKCYDLMQEFNKKNNLEPIEI